MSKLSVEMLKDIEKDTVDFSPNYDDRLKEPNVLPSHFPNILVNGSTGIAVGMATNIPPHNMGEVLDGVCAMVDNPDIDLDGLMQYIKGPDFPTGGIIMGRSGIRAAYGTGRGRIYVRARAEIVEKPSCHIRSTKQDSLKTSQSLSRISASTASPISTITPTATVCTLPSTSSVRLPRSSF